MSAVVELALRMLAEAMAQADWSSRASLLRTMREPWRDIVAIFGEQAAWAAVRYLEQDREAAGVFSHYPEPLPADPANRDRADGTLGWTTEPSDDAPTPDANPAIVQQKMSGAVTRLINQPARDTVWNATVAAGTRYARMPVGDADTCEWCLMLASRGAVYSRDAVVTVTARSSRPEGSRFHDACRCSSIEVRTEDDLPEINQRLEELWIEHGGTFDQWRDYLKENPFGTTRQAAE